MLTLVIANKSYSSWSLRPWLLMRQLGIPFNEVRIPLDQPDTADRIREYSPTGRVPILVDDEFTVWDSLAIIEYLADLYPEAGVWPSVPRHRARARALVAEMHSGFSALRVNLPMNIRMKLQPRARTPDVDADIARIRAIWNACRTEAQASEGDDGFLFGRFCAADAFFSPVVTRFETYGVEVAPIERNYMDRMLAMPSMQQWIAEAHAEPERIAFYDQTDGFVAR